jgi:hypothetical protein
MKIGTQSMTWIPAFAGMTTLIIISKEVLDSLGLEGRMLHILLGGSLSSGFL